MAFCSPRPSCEGQELASFHGAYGTPRENPSLKLLTHNLEEPRMETWDSNGASSVRGFLNVWFSPLDRSLRRVFRQPARSALAGGQGRAAESTDARAVPQLHRVWGRRTSGRSHPPGDLDACCGVGSCPRCPKKGRFQQHLSRWPYLDVGSLQRSSWNEAIRAGRAPT